MRFAWIVVGDVPEIVFLAPAETQKEFLELAGASEKIKARYYEDYQEYIKTDIFTGSFADFVKNYLSKEEDIFIVPYAG